MEKEEYIAAYTGDAKEVTQRLYELIVLYWRLQYRCNPQYAKYNDHIKPEDIAKRYVSTTVRKCESESNAVISELSKRLNQGGFPVTWLKADDAYILQIGYTQIRKKT